MGARKILAAAPIVGGTVVTNSWSECKRLFQEALQRPADERFAFLEGEDVDESVRQQVRELLESHLESDGFLEFEPQSFSPSGWIGKTVGDFQIVKLIGRGGHGSVFEAQQLHPQRTVAIKILRDDFHIPEKQRRRFEFEAEALASLKHPGIAHVYARGELIDDGSASHPWFAMELVRGKHLLDYVREHDLNQKQRLALFVKICEAVQHAHQNQIIHRDLKPANILIPHAVADRDVVKSKQPKVVDFGIAKSLVEDSTADPTRDIIGTLNYASPEQVCEPSEKIDYRTDIYSLGVILYELLTGQLPHDRSSGSLTDLVQKIQSATKPDFDHSKHRVPLDLQSILRHAMAFRPEDRYRTVQHFQDDIGRYLNHQPVAARPPSLAISAARFAQRNLVLVTAIVAAITVLSIGIVLYAREASLARKAAASSSYEAEKATAVSSYITNDFLTQLMAKSRAGKLNADEVEKFVADSEKLIRIRFADKPKIQAAIHNELGTVLYNMQRFDAAGQQYRIALDLWSRALNRTHADSLKALSNLAQSELAKGLSPEAEALCKEAYELRVKVLGPSDPATLRSLNNYAEILRKLRRTQEAEILYKKGLETYEDGTQPDVTYITLAANYGSLLLKQGDESAALKLHQQVHQYASTILGAEHVLTLRSAIRLVQTLDRTDNHDRAWQKLQPVLKVYEAQSKNEPAILITPYRLAARICRHLGNQEKAIDFLRKAKRIAEAENQLRQVQRIERELKRLGQSSKEVDVGIYLRQLSPGFQHQSRPMSLLTIYSATG